MGRIAGTVFRDDNEDGDQDPGEDGLRSARISLYRSTSEGLIELFQRSTEVGGEYEFDHLSAGAYTVSIAPRPDGKLTTSNPLIVTLLELDNGNCRNLRQSELRYPPAARAEDFPRFQRW